MNILQICVTFVDTSTHIMPKNLLDIHDDEIRQRISFGEDSYWEFKQIEFKGDQPVSPRRNDLADELIAFANAEGGFLMCGVTDDGQIQGMSRQQMVALNQMLVEISSHSVDPPLRINVVHRSIDDKTFVLVEIRKGVSVHARSGRAYIRVGGSKRRLTGNERLRLAQKHAQSRFLWLDQQVVENTGFETLEKRLWAPLISSQSKGSPIIALSKIGLLTDDGGVFRATVAGILLCTNLPQQWLPHAMIMATMYHGKDRTSKQLDSQEISGPLQQQISDAVKFVVRNMRVVARKTPARENIPQYSEVALFESIVNAVVHRDYSMSSMRIRLSMFEDRLEIDSPGHLPNGLTIESMNSKQSTRNETLASIFGRLQVGEIPGSRHRRYMMERRGDGVPLILDETLSTSGLKPDYQLIDQCNLVLTIPAAKVDYTPSDVTITVSSCGNPINGADVMILFPNKSWHQDATDESGSALFHLYAMHLPLTVFVAKMGYSAHLEKQWIPIEQNLTIELNPLKAGGGLIIKGGFGVIPGLHGQINPMRDFYDRLSMYATNISVEEGQQQPVYFSFGETLRLMDTSNVKMLVTVEKIIGDTALIQYQQVHQFPENESQSFQG